jgi:hypothetical protein
LQALADLSTARAGDAETVEMLRARARTDFDRAYDLVTRRFAVNPEMWMWHAVTFAAASSRPAAALRFFVYADSVKRTRVNTYRSAAYALHHLGRFREEVELAARMRQRMPHATWHYRTVEITGRAGAGDVAGVRRLVVEGEATPEPTPAYNGSAGTRTWIAGLELMAHGHEEEGRELLASTLPYYRRLQREGGAPPGFALGQEVEVLLATSDKLDDARELLTQAMPKLRSAEDSTWFLSLLGQIAARAGKRDEALSYVARMTWPRREPGDPPPGAPVIARLGDREDAVRRMQGLGYLDGHRYPAFFSLRGYPPFEQLLKPKG